MAHPGRGHTGRHRGGSGGRGRGKHGRESLLWFPHKGTGEAGEANSGLASLNNFMGSGA